MNHIVIIGNGISGITTARHVRKLTPEDRITVISAETDHFFSRTALMYIYMGHMKYEHTKPYEDWFWEKNRIELVRNYVKEFDAETKSLTFADGTTMSYDKLVLAVGSTPNKFGWPGQDLPGVQGLYSFQDLETLEENTIAAHKVERAVIVGGGLIGVELAEMLLTRNIAITFLVREDRFWGNVLPKEEGELIMRHMKEHHIDLRLNTELEEIIEGPDGRACGVRTKAGEEIKCQVVGLTAGVSPNIKFLKGGALETQRGIMVNQYLETNLPDVYALGDCAQFDTPPPGRRPIEQVWYTGRMQGQTLAHTLVGNRTKYEPGFWFNSAKFFDIEYQTYGTVLPAMSAGEKDFYWEHANGKICVKIVFNASSRLFVGINVFGIRCRHERFDKWLREKRSVEFVLEHLRDANFDPEFYKAYEEEIVSKFNSENGTTIKVKRFSWKRLVGASA
jgi:NADPH-dependent 2,4-dienoyl-CoA reductase/sulfur reductase-like enzyme